MKNLLNSVSGLAYNGMVMNEEGGSSGGDGGDDAAAAAAAAAGSSADNEHWTNGMDDDTKTYLAGKGFDKLEQGDAFNNVLKSYRSIETKMGAGDDKIIMRPDMSDPDAVSRFHSDLGRPDEATGYKAPEGDVDPTFFGAMQNMAFKAGLSEDQMSVMGAGYQEFAASQLETAQNELNLQQDAEVNDLRKDWGSDFDRRVTESGRFAKESGMPDEIQDLIENGNGSKALLEWTFKMSQATASGDTVNSQTDSRTTPKEAEGQKISLMNELKVDPVRLAKYNKGAGADFDKMQRLIKLSVPTG